VSYDLCLRPRSGSIPPERFFEFFRRRPHYEVEGSQAFYRNPDTGVYFVFEESELDPEEDEEAAAPCPFAFNLNFFRPSTFVHEAEPEISALVREHDLEVDDPQGDMADGVYRPERLVHGWKRGNERAFAAARDQGLPRPASLPAARLHEIWRWNHGRDALQAEIGDSRFVPRILFHRVAGALSTTLVWPDGMPTFLPRVDHVLVGRDSLAPRRLLGRKESDLVVLPYAEVLENVAPCLATWAPGVPVLDYDAPPRAIARYVSGVRRSVPELEAVSEDCVLDRELVEKHMPWT